MITLSIKDPTKNWFHSTIVTVPIRTREDFDRLYLKLAGMVSEEKKGYQKESPDEE